jgi:hypothetical protein
MTPTDTLMNELRASIDSDRELASLLDVWSRRIAEDPAWTRSTEPYRHLGRRFLSLEVAPLAKEVAQAALDLAKPQRDGSELRPWANDVELRQILGLALARTADVDGAQAVFRQLRDEGHADEETLGTLARTYKDQAMLATSDVTRRQLLGTSRDIYAEAAETRGAPSYWTMINVATLARLLGDEAGSMATAKQVYEECGKRLLRLRPGDRETYWLLAIMGEAALNLRNLADAEHYYRKAYQAASRSFGDINTTRRQAGWLLENLGENDVSLLDSWLPIPNVVVFAGHMIDRDGRAEARFPAGAEHVVKSAIKRWLQQHNALVGFSSAACGADILFQEALHELGGECRLVLPYRDDQFIVDSVDIVSEGNWPERFATVMSHAAQIIYTSDGPSFQTVASFGFANEVRHGLARLRADELRTKLVGLAVWDGRPGDGPGGTENAVRGWQTRNLDVYQVNVSRLADSSTWSEELRPKLVDGLAGSIDLPADDARTCASSTRAFLVADVEGFSRLPDSELPAFVDEFLGSVANLIEAHEPTPTSRRIPVRQTWGDGLFLTFVRLEDAGRFALDLVDLVRETDWSSKGLSRPLRIRVALHAGPVHLTTDPITGRATAASTHITRAARLEPKTPPNEVYASEAFAALSAVQEITAFNCEYVKQLAWAKHFGVFPTYVVRRDVSSVR